MCHFGCNDVSNNHECNNLNNISMESDVKRKIWQENTQNDEKLQA